MKENDIPSEQALGQTKNLFCEKKKKTERALTLTNNRQNSSLWGMLQLNRKFQD